MHETAHLCSVLLPPLQDVRDGENADVLADPFGAGRLWERFTLQWQGEGAGGGACMAGW